ncbi:MAG TPA: metal ABC transporter ATP-binding protein [Longimicrobiales bacterium]|nr:metal ABC transporter ATP-binding protein [Longimicrobiales bacterium]
MAADAYPRAQRAETDPGRPVVAFRDVTLGYGSTPVLTDLAFEIHEGDFVGLVGPNGSGKTTILRAILGTLEPMAGRVERGQDLRFGYVPQRQALDYGWPLRTMDVVLMGRYDRVGLMQRPGAEDREAALEALEHVGVRELASRRFQSLSGGQKQRALIARALVGRPSLLLLDEPTDGMDVASTGAILELVRDLHRSERLTVVMVSHQLNEVANDVDRLALVVEGGFQMGTADELLTGSNLSELFGVPMEVDTVKGFRMVHTAAGQGGGGVA